MGMHAGYFSNERKGDIIFENLVEDVQVVQFCISEHAASRLSAIRS